MSFSRLLRLFGDSKCILKGRTLHGKMITSGFRPHVITNNHLLAMYMKFKRINDAQKVFDEMPERNVISWSALISGFSQSAMPKMALNFFGLMVSFGFEPNYYTYVGAVSACASIGDARSGKEIHGRIFRSGLELNGHVSNCLINMYGKCGFLRKAGVAVNEFSCVSVLGACAALQNLKFGMQIHSLALKYALEFDMFVVTGLINLYAKCGVVELACKVFSKIQRPDLSAWTALIGGYVQLGKGWEAINLFVKMYTSGLMPSEITFSSVLGAFADVKDIEGGRQLHALIIKMGFSSFTSVGNTVLDFYSKFVLLEESLKIFQEIDERDVVSWNALIAGHVGSAIGWGKQTHCCIIKPGYDSNVVIGSALIDMYAKCGRLIDARKVFDNLSSKNLVSWNTMLVGYAQHGLGREALEIYSLMQENKIKPNDITFIGVLSACGHVGLVEEGWHYFNSMINDHGIAPRMDHIASMVNLFARRGQTRRAYEFINSSPIEPDKVVWRCLLSGCRTHKDVVLGKYAAEKILSIDPEDISAHIMLSNVYAEAKMWDETARVRKIMKEKSLKKDTGYSWTELKNKMHYFSTSRMAQLQGVDLREVLNGLTAQLFNAGYVPDAIFLYHCEE
ncbi:Pentatricopeptide repeat-containing protein [Melia azedarach]|uniref:Pentatricopeptide repeat-containing protein n=1 Tax=Melia azedarach TaxID=155640 RepID=A0ACC1YAL4_MELAZ|nr:Pentatricopeptide repeat-containing protein [Melia azedarach]